MAPRLGPVLWHTLQRSHDAAADIAHAGSGSCKFHVQICRVHGNFDFQMAVHGIFEFTMVVHGNKGGHLLRVVANVPWYQKQYLVQLPEIVGFWRIALGRTRVIWCTS